MIDETSFPHAGQEIDGYRALVSPGVNPRFWRFHLHHPTWQLAYLLLTVAPVLGFGAIWLGLKLISGSRVKTMLLGVVLCGAGALMIGLGFLLGILAAWTARQWGKQFRHRLLIPGVVISQSPLEIASLADLGKDPSTKGQEFGLTHSTAPFLPGHSTEVGTRIPCVADFGAQGPDRFYYYSPSPVCQVTSDAFDLNQCLSRLGEAPFQRLEQLVARQLTPGHWNQMVVVDANNEVLETRGYMDADAMGKAYREEQEKAKREKVSP